MDLISFSVFVLLLILLAAANLAERGSISRRWIEWALTILNISIALVGVTNIAAESIPPEFYEMVPNGLDPAEVEGIGTVGLILIILSALASLPLMEPVREGLARFLPKPTEDGQRGFEPDSVVHMTALVYIIYFTGQNLLALIQFGTMEEMAQSLEGSVGVYSAVMTAVILLAASLLGTGLGTRREPPNVLARLGITLPTQAQALAGIGLGFTMVVAQLVMVGIWFVLTPESFQEQTEGARVITTAFASPLSGFILAVSASIGEEMAFRGAIQPVFGLAISSIVFTAAHIQYALTPATAFILLLALVLGLIRRRANTTTAMLCHFTYNFILILISILGQQALT